MSAPPGAFRATRLGRFFRAIYPAKFAGKTWFLGGKIFTATKHLACQFFN